MHRILVSACLLGVCCRYDGRGNERGQVLQLLGRPDCQLIPACAEQLGGLPTPRIPSERWGDRVVSKTGMDVTEQFTRGAEEVLRLAKLYGCTAAVLKERSPSCGFGQIYDGSFSKTLVPGNGMTAQKLTEAGIPVFGESQMDQLTAFLDKA